MNYTISKKFLEHLRNEYPAGTRVELIHMDDPYNTKLFPGARGTVLSVDDIGTNGKFRIMLSKIRTPPFSLCNQ